MVRAADNELKYFVVFLHFSACYFITVWIVIVNFCVHVNKCLLTENKYLVWHWTIKHLYRRESKFGTFLCATQYNVLRFSVCTCVLPKQNTSNVVLCCRRSGGSRCLSLRQDSYDPQQKNAVSSYWLPKGYSYLATFVALPRRAWWAWYLVLIFFCCTVISLIWTWWWCPESLSKVRLHMK